MNKSKNGARAEKAKIIVISVVLAVIAWVAIMWVDNPDITTTLSDLDVRFIGETQLRENGLVITGKDEIPPMSASVRGKRSDLMDYMESVHIEVDASGITEAGEYTLPGSLSLPNSLLTVEKEKHGDVPITVEKLAEKKIEVKIKQTGAVKNKLVKSVIDEPNIEISGAKSEIDQVAYAVATVDISDVREDRPEPSGYVLMDADGNLITKNETIETNTLSVDVRHTVYDLVNLPVEAELDAELKTQYSISAVTVTPSRIDAGTLEETENNSLKAVINKISEDGSLEGVIEVPDGMYVPEESKTVKIKAEVKKIVTKPVELDIKAENAPEGRHISIDRVSVTLSGEEDKLTGENIRATVDLSGMGTGVHSVPVKIEGDGITAPDNCYANVTIE